MVGRHNVGNRGGGVNRLLGRSLRMLMIAAGGAALGGCSTAPEWARPGFIYGDENAAAAIAAPSGIETFPELVDVPERRSPSTTAEQRADMRRELSADQDRAKRTDQILEEGGSTIAPPVDDVLPSGAGDGAALAPSLSGFAVSQAPQLAPWALEAAGPVIAARYRETHGLAQGLRWAPPVPARADSTPPIAVNLAALDYLPGGSGRALAKAAWGRTDLVTLVEPTRVAEVAAVVDPAFSHQGGPGDAPPYVVFFDHGSAAVTDFDRDMLAQAVDAQREHGGVLRIVGHASSRAGPSATDRDKLVNFKMSLNRATVVAQELIRRGADPAQVIIEARGDGELAYIETMPEGEAGNRRAEIFLEFGEGAPLMTGATNRL